MPPYAFTEHGVAMLSSVLRSKRAIQINILIIRAFVRFRQILAANSQLAHKVEDLERRTTEHGEKIEALWEAMQSLIAQPEEDPDRPKIGYHTERGSA
jgi:hypothetical protein